MSLCHLYAVVVLWMLQAVKIYFQREFSIGSTYYTQVNIFLYSHHLSG